MKIKKEEYIMQNILQNNFITSHNLEYKKPSCITKAFYSALNFLMKVFSKKEPPLVDIYSDGTCKKYYFAIPQKYKIYYPEEIFSLIKIILTGKAKNNFISQVKTHLQNFVNPLAYQLAKQERIQKQYYRKNKLHLFKTITLPKILKTLEAHTTLIFIIITLTLFSSFIIGMKISKANSQIEETPVYISESYHVMTKNNIVISESEYTAINNDISTYLQMYVDNNISTPIAPYEYITSYSHYTLNYKNINTKYRNDSQMTINYLQEIYANFQYIWRIHGYDSVDITITFINPDNPERAFAVLDTEGYKVYLGEGNFNGTEVEENYNPELIYNSRKNLNYNELKLLQEYGSFGAVAMYKQELRKIEEQKLQGQEQIKLDDKSLKIN